MHGTNQAAGRTKIAGIMGTNSRQRRVLGAVNDQVFFSRNQRWILKCFPKGKPICTRDDHQMCK